MEPRIQIDQVDTAAYPAVYALEKYLSQSQLTPIQKELVKIRASQLNHCAFCIDMHTKDALQKGETVQRILLLNAWRESDLFSREEKLLLQVTEEVTLIHQAGLTEDTYQKALAHFGAAKLAQLIMAIATINVWNRLAVSTLKPLPANTASAE